ncbi:PR domain zinc finger protein 10-like [Pollicipes pollicipes]|uniref:PR domain zinc finger protein 10-like n=1 Tax=Pollicipes pollicipes TaxID=41117 RepID=UPI0018853E89|nr:PR domain zinc finger protein 10-like [Pollicipes pollicipes]
MEPDADEGLLEMECDAEDGLLPLEHRERLFEREGGLSSMESEDGEALDGVVARQRAALADGGYRPSTDDDSEGLEAAAHGVGHMHEQEGGPDAGDGRRPSPARRARPGVTDVSQLPVIYLSEGLDAALAADAVALKAEQQSHLSAEAGDERAQAAHQNDFWCEECCSFYRGRCPDHQVRLISDRPMQSRAWASLPTSYLAIRAVTPGSDDQGETVYGVTAKKTIPKRTQFGPMEGIVVKRDRGGTAPNPTGLVLSVDSGGQLHTVDVSNPDCSNWMRFVRRSETLAQQNLVLNQQGSHLFFTSSRVIEPREELRAGYSLPYAARRGLTMLVAKPENLSEPTCAVCEEGVECQCAAGEPRASRPRRPPRRYRPAPEEDQEWPLTCDACDRIFVSLASLERHECGVRPRPARARQASGRQRAARQAETAARRDTARWQCQYCPLHFESASTLNLHTLAHAALDLEDASLAAGEEEDEDELGLPPDQPLDCPECSKEFLVKEDLICHVASHGTETMSPETDGPQDPRPFKCTPCGRAFTHEEWLKRHLLTHVPDEEKPVSCSTCGRRFFTVSALQCHRRVHSAAARRYQCPLCRQTFEQITALREHVRMHAVDGKYTCPHCEKSFDGYMVIRKHIRSFHNDRVFVCSLCYKPCQSTDKLKLHMLKHSDHREFLCSECGKQFKRKDKLKEHVKRLHSAERKAAQERALRHQKQEQYPSKVSPTDYHRFIYKCHKCKLGFKRRGMLVNHLAKRHPDMGPEQVPELMLPILKTTKDFYCQYCEKTYKSSSKRKAHILKNHPGAELPVSSRGVKLSPGENADQTSYSQTVGSVTMSPHRCSWCHKQYASRAKLLQHQRKKHVELMPPDSQLPRVLLRPRGAGDIERDLFWRASGYKPPSDEPPGRMRSRVTAA